MKPLSRRTFLRGSGASLALPLLEAMELSGLAAKNEKPPIRTAFFYIPNGVVQSAWNPTETGRNFALSPTLKPIESIREKITLFSNLDRIKVPGTDGHAQASSCYLTTARPDELSPAGYPLKRTIDQVIASETGRHTAFRSLELSCNPYEDNRESVYFDNISWFGPSHVARSIRDPKAVFNRLFNVTEHAAHRSVLDLVMEDARSVRHKLGKRDQAKLGEYMDSVRTVEQQIERVNKRQREIDRMKIVPPTKPWQAMRRDEFIRVMGDLMILALQTDLTRVATLMTGPERWSSPLTVHGLFDNTVSHHSMTHNQNKERVRHDLEALERFHVEQFHYVAERMDAIEESNGTLLDNSMFVFGSGLSSGELHITNNLPTLIAGKAGGALRTNRHEKFAEGTPIANLWVSMANINEVHVDQLGDSTGALRLT
ncbi:MAG: hypothetical protein CMO80_07780 [Verrucomicrobiales bacterium]|nr:hypothetical protein [Verrucomicrobiales bacterium]|tara:strand:+ start:6195 stop:7478 length:1284 start_codon:yes stop_codon:yes gene_type:complete